MLKNNVLSVRNSAKRKTGSVYYSPHRVEKNPKGFRLSSTSQYLLDYSHTILAMQSIQQCNTTAYTITIAPLEQAAWTVFGSLPHLLHVSAKIHLNLQLTLKCKPLSNP